jgi:predicted RecB family nuclease
MGTKITRDVLESRLHCKFKAHLKLMGEQASKSDYETLQLTLREEVKSRAVEKLLAKHPDSEGARNVPLTETTLRAGPSFVLDAILEDDDLSLVFDGLKKVEGASKLGDFHYLPVLFHERRKVRKEERRMLEVYGLLLSRIQGKARAYGIVWHGAEGKATKVRLSADMRKTAQLFQELKEMVASGSQPKLRLNDHCHVCEFKQRCHAQAVQEDSLSLLRGMSEKEVKKYARKGIFTLTQLAHTFRPRRKGKRKAKATNRHYHALQAMAIRDKKVYVLGTPELPDSPVRLYLDVEGDPDEGYVYLIGVIVVQGELKTRYSFWADSKEQEQHIFDQFLALLEGHEAFRVYCYGSYERTFLKRMCKEEKKKKLTKRVLDALCNTLSLVYTHVYFPTYSNGLKDVGGCLGCAWTEPEASGTQSIVWRKNWEATKGEGWKRKLTTYNMEDCVALEALTVFLFGLRMPGLPPDGPGRNPPVPEIASVQGMISPKRTRVVSQERLYS